MSPHVFRLVDANVNRASEGLRVLEDLARFVIADEALSHELKTARHEVSRLAQPLDMQLLSGRDAGTDVGRETDLRSGEEQGYLAVTRANAKRVEESLRVIEEFTRLPELANCVDRSHVERLRYATYDLEKRLIGRVARTQRAALIEGLYVVVDRQAAGSRSLVELAEKAIGGGAGVVQLRDKTGEKGEVYSEAVRLNDLCRDRKALFIMNDHCDIAAAVGAAGLHVGQLDMPLEAARRLLPIDTIIGVSCENAEQVRRAVVEGADYIAVGAVFPTAQKAIHAPVGLEVLASARAQVGTIPLVAIGGIGLQNVGSVIDAGADAVAVIGAVVMQRDVRRAAAEMTAAIRIAKERGRQHG
jgi:thiamine-phosphate pyrophosphorylase